MNLFHASLKKGRARTNLTLQQVLFLMKAGFTGGAEAHIQPLSKTAILTLFVSPLLKVSLKWTCPLVRNSRKKKRTHSKLCFIMKYGSLLFKFMSYHTGENSILVIVFFTATSAFVNEIATFL